MNNVHRNSLVSLLVVCILGMSLTVAALSPVLKPTPFKGRGSGQIVGVVPGLDGVAISAVGSGNSTHLGRFSRTEQLLLDPGTGTFTGSIVFTAANGDELWCSLSGGFTGPGIAEGTYSVTGGTGRFAAATGSAAFNVAQSDPVNFTFNFIGEIETH